MGADDEHRDTFSAGVCFRGCATAVQLLGVCLAIAFDDPRSRKCERPSCAGKSFSGDVLISIVVSTLQYNSQIRIGVDVVEEILKLTGQAFYLAFCCQQISTVFFIDCS